MQSGRHESIRRQGISLLCSVSIMARARVWKVGAMTTASGLCSITRVKHSSIERSENRSYLNICMLMWNGSAFFCAAVKPLATRSQYSPGAYSGIMHAMIYFFCEASSDACTLGL